jgi:hypothetical protein
MVLVGTRTLRAEFLVKSHKENLPGYLGTIEKQVEQQQLEVITGEGRLSAKRFAKVFEKASMFSAEVMVEGLQLGKTESINGQAITFDEELLIARDKLVFAYKPVHEKLRELASKELEFIPARLLMNFCKAYFQFEDVYLLHKEIHAVEALQPLAICILSLEPLAESREKEGRLAWPRVQHQRTVTLRALEGYCKALGDLSAYVLSSLQRELSPDPRLLMLLEYVHAQSQEPDGATYFLSGISATPEVAFPDAGASGSASMAQGLASFRSKEKGAAAPKSGMALQAYSFRLLGPLTPVQTGPVTQAQARALHHAKAVLQAFDDVKDYLFSLKSKLEYIDPHLDRNPELHTVLSAYESSFKKAKRLFLEPGNLV